MVRQVSVEGRPVHSLPLCWVVGYLSAAPVVDELYSEAPECGYVLEFVEYLLLLPLSLLPPSRVEPEQPGRSTRRSVAREPPPTSLPCLTRHRSKSSRRSEQLTNTTHIALNMCSYNHRIHIHTPCMGVHGLHTMTHSVMTLYMSHKCLKCSLVRSTSRAALLDSCVGGGTTRTVYWVH